MDIKHVQYRKLRSGEIEILFKHLILQEELKLVSTSSGIACFMFGHVCIEHAVEDEGLFDNRIPVIMFLKYHTHFSQY